MSELDYKRLFLGIPLPKESLQCIATFREAMPAHPYIRWVEERHLHITVFFMGKVPAEMLDNLQALIALGLKGFAPFEIDYEAFVLAPKPKEPRMYWLKLRKNFFFIELVNRIHRLYTQIDPDLQMRKRPTPHITLARLKNFDPSMTIPLGFPIPAKPLKVDKLILWESTLRPEGVQYELLREYLL